MDSRIYQTVDNIVFSSRRGSKVRPRRDSPFLSFGITDATSGRRYTVIGSPSLFIARLRYVTALRNRARAYMTEGNVLLTPRLNSSRWRQLPRFVELNLSRSRHRRCRLRGAPRRDADTFNCPNDKAMAPTVGERTILFLIYNGVSRSATGDSVRDATICSSDEESTSYCRGRYTDCVRVFNVNFIIIKAPCVKIDDNVEKRRCHLRYIRQIMSFSLRLEIYKFIHQSIYSRIRLFFIIAVFTLFTMIFISIRI